MTAGKLLWRSTSGTWDVVGWSGVADEIAHWREWLSEHTVDPGDRRAVAALSRSVPASKHSLDWGYQMAQMAERLTNRP